MPSLIIEEQLKKLDCGLIKCPMDMAIVLMPCLIPIFKTSPIEMKNYGQYVVDVKVHMLMPGQYPCIPGWHCDLVPRDENKKQDFSKVDTNKKMYLWLSGTPITEFKDGREIKAQYWNEFTQLDEHRGRPATEHCWRMFIRIAPIEIYKPNPLGQYKRRHCQVYLDAENFKW